MTGTQRSGTTWVGKILSAHKDYGYVHEPFNRVNHLIHDAPIEFPFQFVNESIDANSQKAYSKYLNYFLNPSWKFLYRSLKGIKYVDSRYISPLRQFTESKSSGKVKIIKDPFALFSCEWLYSLGWEIIIMCRHPAAYALSMLEKDWILTPRVLEEQSDEISHFYKGNEQYVHSYLRLKDRKNNLIESAIHAWNLQYCVIDYYRRKFPDWTLLYHEDLSRNPLSEFAKVFSNLGLDMEDSAVNQVKSTTEGSNLTGLKRNSSRNAQKWQSFLSNEQVKSIRQGTSRLWPEFYDETDWAYK